MKINRRTFFKFLTFSIVPFFLSPIRFVWGQNKKKELKKWPDLVGVKDGSAAQMVEIGIKAIGGMERFVKKGQTVLIKPNIAWNKSPNEGANTQPDLVQKVIELVKKAGASKVHVFDNTCNMMAASYKNSGIEDAVKAAGGILLDSDKEKYYRKVKIPGAKIVKEAQVHYAFRDADVVINIPVLKHHRSARMTSALKNYMGVIWDRRFWHRNGLMESISEFTLYRKADLTIVDAFNVMVRNGPMGVSTKDVVLKKMQILSTDEVLADTAAAKILGLTTKDVSYLEMAEKKGLGSTNLEKAQIKRISCRKS